ncbi:MAG: hypothetical protein IJV66_02745 [Firmicutes bacterium]|nr:hypothetical protein [Bacillota bacterium]
MKRLTVDLFNRKSWEDAAREVEALADKVEDAGPVITEKLAEIGKNIAEPAFQNARYAGHNDVTVTVEEIQNGHVVRARGWAAPFIEFGTGIGMGQGYPDDPGRPAGIAGLGEYGQHKGAHPPWGYYGDIGSHPPNGTFVAGAVGSGTTAKSRNGRSLIITHGNRPAAGMAAAAAEVQVNAMSVAKGVLK